MSASASLRNGRPTEPTGAGRWAAAVTLFLIVLPFSFASAGPITFSSALPVSSGEGILRGQAVVTRASGDSTPMDRSLTAVAAPSVLVYGLTPKLTLFGVVPFFVHKSINLTTPAGSVSRGSNGFGDVVLFGRYTLLQIDEPGSTLRIAPFAGLKVPTGSDTRSDMIGRLPRQLQPGSGSWDPLVGMALTWQTLPWEFDADAGYRFNTRADSFEFGDVAFTDMSFQYRLWPRRLGSGVPGFLYAVLESNLQWQGKNRAHGRVDSNSGGITWFLDPGIQYVTERYVLEAAVRLPAVQSLNGDALGGDFQVVAGMRWNFFTPLSW